MEVRHAPERQRYEILVDGQIVGLADYRDSEGLREFSHTETDPARRGQGLAGQLVQFALDDTRAAGRKVVPSCSYVARYIDRHGQYADLLR